MEEVKGETIVNKYVKKIPAKPKEPSHVGGAIKKKDDELDQFRKMNKLGIDSTKDY